MTERFSVLSKQQTAWMHRAVREMLQVTESYTCRKKPMTEEDYSHVCDVFSGYTKKSRNNEMVIRSSMAFTTYMDELAKKKEGYPLLDKNQIKLLEEAVDEMFDMASGVPEEELSETWLMENDRKLDECCKKFSNHGLVRELTDIFKEYFAFCFKEGQRDPHKELELMTAEHKKTVVESLKAGRKTIIVNAFAGAKAGKTEACFTLVAGLKKAGYAAEYIGECADELASEKKWEKLDGTNEQELEILRVQLERIDAKLGQVDFIVTDAPVLLNQVYNKEISLEWQTMLKELNSHYFSYNFFLQREYPKLKDRSLEELEGFGKFVQKDIEIRAMLAVNGIQHSVYKKDDMLQETLRQVDALHKLTNDCYKEDRQSEKNSFEEGGKEVFRKSAKCHR